MKKPIHIIVTLAVFLTSIGNGLANSFVSSGMVSEFTCMDCDHSHKAGDLNKSCVDGHCDIEGCTFSLSMVFTHESKLSQYGNSRHPVFIIDRSSQFKSQIPIPIYRPPIA